MCYRKVTFRVLLTSILKCVRDTCGCRKLHCKLWLPANQAVLINTPPPQHPTVICESAVGYFAKVKLVKSKTSTSGWVDYGNRERYNVYVTEILRLLRGPCLLIPSHSLSLSLFLICISFWLCLVFVSAHFRLWQAGSPPPIVVGRPLTAAASAAAGAGSRHVGFIFQRQEGSSLIRVKPVVPALAGRVLTLNHQGSTLHIPDTRTPNNFCYAIWKIEFIYFSIWRFYILFIFIFSFLTYEKLIFFLF